MCLVPPELYYQIVENISFGETVRGRRVFELVLSTAMNSLHRYIGRKITLYLSQVDFSCF